MEKSVALKFCEVPDHEDMQINMMCLKSSCKKAKLLCAECFFADHKDHKDKVITLKTLKKNRQVIVDLAEKANSKTNCSKMTDRIDAIKQEFLNLRDFINVNLNEAESKLEDILERFLNFEKVDFVKMTDDLIEMNEISKKSVSKFIAILSDSLDINSESLSIKPEFNPHKNFTKVVEKVENIVVSGVSNIKDSLEELRDAIEIKPVVLDSQLIFSKELAHVDVHLSSSNTTVTLHDVSGGGFKIAMIDVNLLEVGDITIKFLIKKKMSWIGLGVGITELIKDLNFKVTGHQKGSGLYLYSVNGYTWSHSNTGDENQKKTNYPSSDGDIISMHYNMAESTLTYFKKEVQIARITGVDTLGLSSLMPAVFLNGTGDSVSIIHDKD